MNGDDRVAPVHGGNKWLRASLTIGLRNLAQAVYGRTFEIPERSPLCTMTRIYLRRSFRKLTSAVAIALLSCVGCSAKEKPGQPVPRAAKVGTFGVGCVSYEMPEKVGPPSYSTRDVGKPGVPVLTALQKSMIQRISKYYVLGNLRFAFLPSRELPDGFVVFNADHGPCIDAAPGYQVLNTRTSAFYQPGENPFVLRAVPGEDAPTPGPWFLPKTRAADPGNEGESPH